MAFDDMLEEFLFREGYVKRDDGIYKKFVSLDPTVKFGKGSKFGSFVVIERNCQVGEKSFIGNGCVLRPGTRIGDNTLIGHLTVFEGDCSVGNNCVIHAQCHITRGIVIEDGVFIAPLVATGNDRRMSHMRRDAIPFIQDAPVIKRGVRVAIGSTILPGVRIGENALVGAGSVVTRDIPDNAIVIGVPAKIVGEVPEEERI